MGSGGRAIHDGVRNPPTSSGLWETVENSGVEKPPCPRRSVPSASPGYFFSPSGQDHVELRGSWNAGSHRWKHEKLC